MSKTVEKKHTYQFLFDSMFSGIHSLCNQVHCKQEQHLCLRNYVQPLKLSHAFTIMACILFALFHKSLGWQYDLN